MNNESSLHCDLITYSNNLPNLTNEVAEINTHEHEPNIINHNKNMDYYILIIWSNLTHLENYIIDLYIVIKFLRRL